MPLLEITGLRKAFATPDGSTHQVVDVPQFQLEDQTQVALRGTSGSGKTTFLHLIAGILRPDAGRVLLDGTETSALPEARSDRFRAGTVGYIFQTFNLLPGYTCLENVLLGMMFAGRLDRARAVSLLERVGLGDRLHYRPRQLSTGQQQRVAVARALANRPRLVLADEPTGNLDAANAETALQLIRAICVEQGAALLLVSHDRAVWERFERAVDWADLQRSTAERRLTS